MNKETFETFKRVVALAHKLIRDKYEGRKRLWESEIWEKATAIRDITELEAHILEVKKEYDN